MSHSPYDSNLPPDPEGVEEFFVEGAVHQPQEVELELRRVHFLRELFQATPRVWVTPAIVAINVLVYVVMVFSGVDFWSPTAGSLYAWGGNLGISTTGGQWWRLLTCMFIHGGIIHLAFNMWVLWDLGQLVERLMGHAAFFVLYMLSGLFASLASASWNPTVVSVGASGAVFGVAGGLLGVLLRHRQSMPMAAFKGLRNSMLAFLALNLVIGISVPQIDMTAHVGGLAVGFVGGLGLGRKPLGAPLLTRLLRVGLVTAAGAGLLWLGVALTPKYDDFNGALVAFQKVEGSAIKAFQSAEQEYRAGTISDDQFAGAIEQRVLDPWRQANQQLQAIQRVPAAQRDLVPKLQAYARPARKLAIACGILAIQPSRPGQARKI